MPHPTPYPPRHTPRRPWQRLTDTEWYALLPYIYTRSGPGRPLVELRERMNGIFQMVAGTSPWHTLPEEFGKPDTVSRYFRRLTHAGLWRKLVEELVELPAEHPLQTLASWICRACRRARRLLGLRMIFLLRRLNLRSALWAPPWLLPDLDLSETLRTHVLAMFRDRAPGQPPPSRGWFRAMRWLHRAAGGRAAIPRAVQEAWC